MSVPKWLQDNKSFFVPPICNKLIYSNQLKVFFVGGPNQRSDYHIEEGEEFFYMLKGDMELKVMEQGRPKTIVIREGEAFLLSARIPHSPQRFANTMGLVIERERAPKELDGLRYYTADLHSRQVLFERWFYCADLGTQLAPIIKEFLDSTEHKTGIPSANSQLIKPPYSDDTVTRTVKPISLSKWLKGAEEEIETVGRKALFEGFSHFTTGVYVYGGDFKHRIENDSYETFFWQLSGSSEIEIDKSAASLETGHSVIAPPHSKTWLKTQSSGYTLVILMPVK